MLWHRKPKTIVLCQSPLIKKIPLGGCSPKAEMV